MGHFNMFQCFWGMQEKLMLKKCKIHFGGRFLKGVYN